MECLMKSRDDESDGKPGTESSKPRGKVRRSDSQPFDLWLKRGLHRMYDDIAKEPIPEELMKLIRTDKKP